MHEHNAASGSQVPFDTTPQPLGDQPRAPEQEALYGRENQISIIVPFDLGESYIFSVPRDRCEECIWINIFRKANQRLPANADWQWNTSELGEDPAPYREPFGPVARFKYMKPIAGTLDGLCKASSFYADFRFLECVFFTRGIGVAILSGTLRNGISPATWRNEFFREREQLKAALLSFLCHAREAYRTVMDNAASRGVASGEKFVFAVKLPGRRRMIDKARFPYAILFTDAELPVREQHAATLSFAQPLGYRYSRQGLESVTLKIDVGWGETTVSRPARTPEAAQRAVIDAFVVGMASWFALVVMTSLVSRFLRDSYASFEKPRPQLGYEKGRKISLAFMDTANASRPVRWTLRERDILLLDRIHETWSTKRWWSNVEERTTLLSAHHAEVAASLRRRSERRLSALVIGLAAITALSAVRDVADIWCWPKECTSIVMLLILLLAPVLYFVLVREENRHLDD